MRRTVEEPRRIFSGYANSIGATIHKPVKTFLSDTPSVALCPTGGFHSHTREKIEVNVDSRQIIKAERATATVHGEFREDHYLTFATTTVEKLNILDIVTADAVVARVTSIYSNHKADGTQSMPPSKKFHLSGSHFENLRIGGKLIHFTIDPDFEKDEGYEIGKTETAPACLFSEVSDGAKKWHKAEIHIPYFGTVYLGEVHRYSEKIILSMLHFELGCAIDGSGDVACCSTNGPPPHH